MQLPRRVSATVLAEYLGISPQTLRYRIMVGKSPAPGADGLFDRVEGLKAFQRNPKSAAGRKPGWKTKPAPGVGEAEDGDDAQSLAEEGYDPDTRFRLAKARIAEINLGRLREDTIEVKLVQRRAFHFVRLIRDRLDAKVPRSSPVIAAELRCPKCGDGADEGLTFRLLRKMMREVETEVAEMDFDAVLKGGIPEEREEEAEGEAEEGDDDPLPKLKPKLPRRRKQKASRPKPKSKGGR